MKISSNHGLMRLIEAAKAASEDERNDLGAKQMWHDTYSALAVLWILDEDIIKHHPVHAPFVDLR